MSSRNGGFDPLWVPVLTHYRVDGSLDAGRCAAQIAAIAGDVRQLLIAGTTGDGWEMPDAILDAWLELAGTSLTPDHRLLVGAFAADAAGVIARARRIERHFADRPGAVQFAGLAICAPVDASATQAAIAAHLDAIIGATTPPIAL